MSYVHGHARRVGWVIGHYRRPNRPGDAQLALTLLMVPRPRVSSEARAPAGAPAGRG